METFYGRAVFFVRGAEAARQHYVQKLGFTADWGSPADGDVVCQVSLFGFELILNEDWDKSGRAGHGRVFIGLEDDQAEAMRRHIAEKKIETTRVNWGRDTAVIKDVDGNELYWWSL